MVRLDIAEMSSREVNRKIKELIQQENEVEIDNTHSLARRVIEIGLAVEGQNILVVRGFSDDPKQNTPNLTVVTI